MNWEKYKREDGSINLADVFDSAVVVNSDKDFVTSQARLEEAYRYLRDVEILCPVRSRQVAALVLATAKSIARQPNSPV